MPDTEPKLESISMDFCYDVESTCSDEEPYIVVLKVAGVGAQCTTEYRMTRAEVKDLLTILNEAEDEIDNYFTDLETEAAEGQTDADA